MDGGRFDRFTLAFGRGLTRRRAGLLIAVGFGLGLDSPAETEARKKRKKPCPVCRFRRRGTCKGKKPDGTPCGDDGNSCRNGACVCFPAERACEGFCCPEGQVCDIAENRCANPGACAPVTGLACLGPSVTCNGNFRCECLRDVDGNTRCGTFVESGAGCNVCQDNDDCVERTGITGAFCVESGSDACCSPGQKFCRVPCPTQAQ